MAYFAVLFIVVILSLLVIAMYTQMMAGLKQVAMIADDTSHFYKAEAILAKGINGIKKKTWNEWVQLTGGIEQESGVYRESQYVLSVEATKDSTGGRVPGMVDLFVKVTEDETTLSYFDRIRIKQASDLRPTQVEVRRFARAGSLDPEDDPARRDFLAMIDDEALQHLRNQPASAVNVRQSVALLEAGASIPETLALLREAQGSPRPAPMWALLDRIQQEVVKFFRPGSALAGISQDEVRREANRPASSVFPREGQAAVAAGSTLEQAVATLKSTSYADQIEKESIVNGKIRDGDRILFAVPVDPAQLPVAMALYREALQAAESQSAVHRVETIPRCRFRIAQCLARTGKERPFGDPQRASDLEGARSMYLSIVTDFPASPEAPATFIPRAWLEMDLVTTLATATAWNEARDRAYAVLESMREFYPLYHLWHEDAITGTVHPGAAVPADEVVWYVERLIGARVAIVRHDPGNGMWLMTDDASWLRNVGPYPAEEYRTIFQCPRLSPDNRHIAAFAVGYKIWVTDVMEQKPWKLIDQSVSYNFDWLPDASGILFMNLDGGLEAVDVDGGNRRPVWTPPFQVVNFALDPRGRYLAVSQYLGGVHLVDWDPVANRVVGSPRAIVAGNPENHSYPRNWSPDGEYLAIAYAPNWGGTVVVRPDGTPVASVGGWPYCFSGDGTRLYLQESQANGVIGYLDMPTSTFVPVTLPAP